LEKEGVGENKKNKKSHEGSGVFLFFLVVQTHMILQVEMISETEKKRNIITF